VGKGAHKIFFAAKRKVKGIKDGCRNYHELAFPLERFLK
jgi:hypothetical protein